MSAQPASRHRHGFDAGLFPLVEAIVGARARRDVLASSVTTLAIGGAIRALVTVDTAEELGKVVSLLARMDQDVRALGNGSNLLIADEGLDGWVLRLGASFRSVTWLAEDGTVEVGGAASLMSFARKVSDEGWSGLEFAAGIPASIGGAAFMNAGAHGSEIGPRVVRVYGVLADGTHGVWEHDVLPWSYRSSGLSPGMTVTSVVFRLIRGERSEISRLCSEHLAERRARQPLALPSAGSVFKNPRPDLPAGRVLEAAGLKGQRVGGAQISELHANWIVNPEKRATAGDVRQLIELCRTRVRQHSGIELEPELKVWP